MTDAACVNDRPSALDRLRAATRDMHERLDRRMDAIERLADPVLREELLARYAAFHLPADAALAPHLDSVAGLDFGERSRAPLLTDANDDGHPCFPRPGSRGEALGMLYVLEGSTLGGRFILRELTRRGVDDPRLSFLDPYGAETGRRWRGFLDVLERETADDPGSVDAAEVGAVRGFAHAERILCGATA